MKILLIIWCVTVLLAALMTMLLSWAAERRFKEKYRSGVRLRKLSAPETILGYIKWIAVCGIPVFNILVIIVALCYSETIITRTIEVLESRIIKEENQ